MKIFYNKKKNHEEKEEEENENEEITFDFLPEPVIEPQSRLIGLYGQIEEEKCAGVVGGLYHMRETGKQTVSLDPINDPDGDNGTKIEYSPIDFLISTEGGVLTDMFAVYDVMREIQKTTEIHTIGVGKVMSAGLILLAAGTKGKRRVGKTCRLMLHPIASGNYGKLHDLKNDFKEVNRLQDMYIEELSALSKLSEKQIRTFFKKKLDVYFDAKQAVEWGLVDEIV